MRKVEKKLERLAVLNEVLAYKPWIITISHIQELNKGGEDYKLNWSIPEILEAGLILSRFHSLCGLVYGQGLKEDIDIAMSFETNSNV